MTTPSLPVVNTQPEERESPGAEDTLWAVRQALKSDAYAGFREGQLTLVNYSRS